jgi:hypothetical protein
MTHPASPFLMGAILGRTVRRPEPQPRLPREFPRAGTGAPPLQHRGQRESPRPLGPRSVSCAAGEPRRACVTSSAHVSSQWRDSIRPSGRLHAPRLTGNPVTAAPITRYERRMAPPPSAAQKPVPRAASRLAPRAPEALCLPSRAGQHSALPSIKGREAASSPRMMLDAPRRTP